MGVPNRRSRKAALLVVAALNEIGKKNGSTLDMIERHIEKEYAVPKSEIKSYLKRVVTRGIAFGAIRKLRGKLYPGDVYNENFKHLQKIRKWQREHKRLSKRCSSSRRSSSKRLRSRTSKARVEKNESNTSSTVSRRHSSKQLGSRRSERKHSHRSHCWKSFLCH